MRPPRGRKAGFPSRIAFRRRLFERALLLAVIGVGVGAIVAPSKAPADVQEQRARLPPPQPCTDPVEGVWMSHKYDPAFGDWYIFTLTVRRQPANRSRLTGSIESHYWYGGPEQESPPSSCSFALGGVHAIVEMPAVGTVNGQAVEFHGTSWRMKENFCNAPMGYNLDRFSGTIDPAIQEFQSVNNDGGRSVNDPRVFRRIRCLDPLAPPRLNVRRPDFFPETRGWGCSR